MAASKHINPNQLQMFMPAGEIRENYPTVDGGLSTDTTPQDNDATMGRKYAEAAATPPGGESLRDNVLRRGVERPIRLYQGLRSKGDRPEWAKGVLGNGGHRTAVLGNEDPTREVPVLHGSYFSEYEPASDPYAEDYGFWGQWQVRSRHGAD